MERSLVKNENVMKHTSLYLLAGLLFLLSCQKSVDPIEPDGIKLNQVVRLNANRSYVVTRINDSRCPQNVYCIWQGVAQVTVRLNQNSQTDTVNVASFDATDRLFKRTQTTKLDGSTWTVELVDVWPYPSYWYDQLRTDQKVVQLKVSVQ